MSQRIRLTIAAVATALFLAAVSAAGITLHAGSPAPAPSAAAPLTAQSAHTSTPSWHEEHD